MKWLIALLAVITPLGQLAGQTFKETVSWMHNASEYNATLDKDGELNSTEVSRDNTCHKFVIVQKHSGKSNRVWVVTLDLKAIDPKQVYADPVDDKPWSRVWINTANDESRIHTLLTVDGQKNDERDTAGVGLDFGEHTFAARFAKALRHAVVLCGGKPSVF
jgi:hypothetical protein